MKSSLAAPSPTWLWGFCGRHNSLPASSVMDFIFRRSDGSHVAVDTFHPSLLRSSSHCYPRWYHFQSISSDVFLVSPLDVSKPPQSCFHAPLCDVLYFKSPPNVIVSHMVPYCVAACTYSSLSLPVFSRGRNWKYYRM